jgi:nucleotide-binding universal stress UspA family protein
MEANAEVTRTRIVVGVDGGEGSQLALDWAVEEAVLRNWSLLIVNVVEGHGTSAAGSPATGGSDPAWVDGHAIVDEAIRRARGRAPALRVDGHVDRGSPTLRLLRAADWADLLVVSARGFDALPGAMLGAVANNLAAHATTPLVVVRAGATPARGRVVVGVDGSQACLAAVEFAFAEAAWHGVTLCAVHAGADPLGSSAMAAAEMMATYADKYPDLILERLHPTGHPLPALLEASTGADLLVVGSRGHDAYDRALLGSVSLGVLHLAGCPVAVVRA